MTNQRKQSELSKVGLRPFKHSKTTSNFFYSIYHQRWGKTSLFHMRRPVISIKLLGGGGGLDEFHQIIGGGGG